MLPTTCGDAPNGGVAQARAVLVARVAQGMGVAVGVGPVVPPPPVVPPVVVPMLHASSAASTRVNDKPRVIPRRMKRSPLFARFFPAVNRVPAVPRKRYKKGGAVRRDAHHTARVTYST